MGGLEITLDAGVKDAAARASLRAGKQRMDGFEALSFSRARKTLPGGDFTRTKHQGDMLRAAHRQIRAQQSGLPDLTKLLAAFSRNVDTDIPPHQLFRLASLAVNIRPRDVKQISLSGGTGFAGAQSVVYLNAGSAFSDIRKRRIGP
jgi:anionic cell wall polymer biosynthesis LytR-Cps2A-Psr (LCP) family protein